MDATGTCLWVVVAKKVKRPKNARAAKFAKKLVKRGVTELVTPGVAYNDNLLKAGENNWLAALSFSGKEAGLAFLDISTGAFKLAQGSLD